MVLKKSKFTVNTGGTQRKSPFFKKPRAHRNGLIKKQESTVSSEGQNSKQLFDELDGGLTGIQVDLCFSMKKKQRWLIPELIEDQIIEISVSPHLEEFVETGKHKRKSKEKKKKNSQFQEELDGNPTMTFPHQTAPRIVLVENGFRQKRHNECKAVFDSGDAEKPIKKSRSW